MREAVGLLAGEAGVSGNAELTTHVLILGYDALSALVDAWVVVKAADAEG